MPSQIPTQLFLAHPSTFTHLFFYSCDTMGTLGHRLCLYVIQICISSTQTQTVRASESLRQTPQRCTHCHNCVVTSMK